MLPVLSSLACAAYLVVSAANDAVSGSYLWTTVRGPDGCVQMRVESYLPQAGDLVLFNDHSRVWKFFYKMVGSDLPNHSGIVVTLPDGRPALCESAPDDGKLAGLYVVLLEVIPRLHQYQGTIYIRRRKAPLSKEQSALMTDFALAQEGKRYAVCRLLLQGTPFRCRASLRAKLFGKTDLNRSSWLCSELVVATGTVGGLFDPKIHHANRIYPRDLLYDDVYDLSETWYPAGIWMPSASESPAVTP